MNFREIQLELDKIKESSVAQKSDLQLQSIEILTNRYRARYKHNQPPELKRTNSWKFRKTKLTPSQVLEIRSKYKMYDYGKKRLSQEYGVSVSVVYRILKNKTWKCLEIKKN